MTQFLLPDLGEGLEDAQLVAWLVRAGETVALNQPLCQVETAKAMVDIPSPYAGTVERLHAQPGETVAVGAPLISIAQASAAAADETHGPVLVGYGTGGPSQAMTRRRRVPGSPLPASPRSAASRGEGPEGTAVGAAAGDAGARGEESGGAAGAAPMVAARPAVASDVPMVATSPVVAGAPRVATSSAAASDAPVAATPLVRKMAEERGIDLRTVRGTGPGGRIRVEDLESVAAAPPHAQAAADLASGSSPRAAPGASPPSGPSPRARGEAGRGDPPDEPGDERISTVGLRKAIAVRMVRAAATIPHFTEYGLFDATELVALRTRLKGDARFAGQHLTFLPFFVRALVAAVREHRILNSRWDDEGNAIVVRRAVNIGIATDTARGLLVPVIHHADTLDLAATVAEAERLVTLARTGKLDARSMTGGTITITNVGAAGPVDTGAPLINPPEACVVGFGAIKPRPTAVGERVLVRPSCWISISCDHRIVDGATAAAFLGALVGALEAPEALARA